MSLIAIAALLLGCTACTPPVPPGPGRLVGDEDAWMLTFGTTKTDESWGIDMDEAGHLYLSTHQANPTLTDGYIYKLSSTGEVIWETHWGEEYSDEMFAVDVHEGVVHVGGARFTELLDLWDSEALLLRFDAETGELLGDPWRHRDKDAWNEIDGMVITDEHIYLAGWGDSQHGDFLMARLDREGQEEAVVYWGTDAWEEANGHVVAVDETLYVAGRLGADGVWGGGDAVVVAFDTPDMQELWHASWGEEGSTEDVYGLTTDGSMLYAVGVQSGELGLAIWSWDLEGELQWVTSWGGEGVDRGRAIRVDPVDGSVVVAANSGTDGQLDIVMLRLDATSGEILEEHRWGGDKDDEAHDFVLDGDVGYMSAQTRSWGAGGWDAMMVKFEMRPWRFPEP